VHKKMHFDLGTPPATRELEKRASPPRSYHSFEIDTGEVPVVPIRDHVVIDDAGAATNRANSGQVTTDRLENGGHNQIFDINLSSSSSSGGSSADSAGIGIAGVGGVGANDGGGNTVRLQSYSEQYRAAAASNHSSNDHGSVSSGSEQEDDRSIDSWQNADDAVGPANDRVGSAGFKENATGDDVASVSDSDSEMDSGLLFVSSGAETGVIGRASSPIVRQLVCVASSIAAPAAPSIELSRLKEHTLRSVRAADQVRHDLAEATAMELKDVQERRNKLEVLARAASLGGPEDPPPPLAWNSSPLSIETA
jgi:hypothetical protein